MSHIRSHVLLSLRHRLLLLTMSQAFPQHEWESDVPVVHAWDDDPGDDEEGWGGDYSEDEDGPADPKAIAALEFLDIIGSIYKT